MSLVVGATESREQIPYPSCLMILRKQSSMPLYSAVAPEPVCNWLVIKSAIGLLFRNAHAWFVIHSGLDNVKRIPVAGLAKMSRARDRCCHTSPESTASTKLVMALKRVELARAYLRDAGNGA